MWFLSRWLLLRNWKSVQITLPALLEMCVARRDRTLQIEMPPQGVSPLNLTRLSSTRGCTTSEALTGDANTPEHPTLAVEKSSKSSRSNVKWIFRKNEQLSAAYSSITFWLAFVRRCFAARFAPLAPCHLARACDFTVPGAILSENSRLFRVELLSRGCVLNTFQLQWVPFPMLRKEITRLAL